MHYFIWYYILTSAWRFNCLLSIQHFIELYIYKYMLNIYSVFICSFALNCITDHLRQSINATQIQFNSNQHNFLWYSAKWKSVQWHFSNVQWWFCLNIICDQSWCTNWSGCDMYAMNLIVAEFNCFNLYKNMQLYININNIILN